MLGVTQHFLDGKQFGDTLAGIRQHRFGIRIAAGGTSVLHTGEKEQTDPNETNLQQAAPKREKSVEKRSVRSSRASGVGQTKTGDEKRFRVVK